MEDYERLQRLAQDGDLDAFRRLTVLSVRYQDDSTLSSLIKNNKSLLDGPEMRSIARETYQKLGKLSYRLTSRGDYPRPPFNKNLKILENANREEGIPLQPICECNGKLWVRPTTLREVVQTIIRNHHLFLKDRGVIDTFTTVAYSKENREEVVIVPEYPRFLTTSATKTHAPYLCLGVGEFESIKKQGYVISRKEIDNNPELALFYALEEDDELLKSYKNLFDDFNDISKSNGHCFMINLLEKDKIEEDHMRILSLSGLYLSIFYNQISTEFTTKGTSFLRMAHKDSPVAKREKLI